MTAPPSPAAVVQAKQPEEEDWSKMYSKLRKKKF
jgi:hypothetical protein